jgi:hypothetical protein
MAEQGRQLWSQAAASPPLPRSLHPGVAPSPDPAARRASPPHCASPTPGNFAGAVLGYFGADVIKVEPPKGDPIRSLRLLDDSGESLWWRCHVSGDGLSGEGRPARARAPAALPLSRRRARASLRPGPALQPWAARGATTAAAAAAAAVTGSQQATACGSEARSLAPYSSLGSHQGRNKRCVTIDLHNEEGRELVRK